MAMPKPQTEWTLEMVHALPDDGNRYELLDGELLVSPSPSLLCVFRSKRPPVPIQFGQAFRANSASDSDHCGHRKARDGVGVMRDAKSVSVSL